MDQFAWVRLAQQRTTPDDQDWRRLTALHRDGTAKFVLSAANYLETWHRRDPRSRQDLATVMREITDYICISPVQKIVDLEIEYFLLRNLRSDSCNCTAINPVSRIFGRGVAHAFDSPTGRLRLVERIYSDGAEEGPPSSEEEVELIKQVIAQIPSDNYEWWSLAAPAQDPATFGMEFRGEHRRGSEYVVSQEAKAAWFEVNPAEFRRLDHYIAAELTLGLLESMNDIANKHAIDPMEIARWQIGRGLGNAKAWIKELPSAECQFHLVTAKMRNPQWRWQQHDYTDIAAISGALPYVDIMVIEKPWAHVVRAAKLDKKYKTRVVTNVASLRKLLDNIQPTYHTRLFLPASKMLWQQRQAPFTNGRDGKRRSASREIPRGVREHATPPPRVWPASSRPRSMGGLGAV